MDKRQSMKYRKMENEHTEYCSKCGKPKRGSCKTSSCMVQHCACAMIKK